MIANAIVLFALEREAAPFRRAIAGTAGVRVRVCGVGAKAAEIAAAKAIERESPSLLVMAGFGGALREGLNVGDVAVASEVVDANGACWPCYDVGQRACRFFTSTRLLATPDEKRSHATQFDADIVDMESAAVAGACAARGVPFLAVRAVSDAVVTALSPRLLKLLSGGRVSPVSAALALLRQTSLVWEFRRLARDTCLAARRLSEALIELMRSRSAPQTPRRG